MNTNAWIAMLDGEIVPGSCAGTVEDSVEILKRMNVDVEMIARMKFMPVHISFDFERPPVFGSSVIGGLM